MLHTLNDSPWKNDLVAKLRLVQKGDVLLLLSDGVIAAVEGNRFLYILHATPVALYALQEDVEARGLSSQIASSVLMVSYTEFVKFAVQHPVHFAW